MTDSVVVEGQVKLRDGKKWKTRWLLLRKPSPVADCLLMLVFKEKADRTRAQKERSSVTLQDICGLDPGLAYEGLSHTLAIICRSQVVMLGFDCKEAMWAWDARIRYALGEVHRFSVCVAPGTKLDSGPATLHLCNDLLVLAKDVPPAVMGHWRLSDLRRFGAVPDGFIFEGGTRCGFWAGVFFLCCPNGEQLSFLFDCIVRGISPTKGPFGLRPALPDVDPTSAEERMAHETLQLEKRLSLLSHSSRPCSGGDDRSLSSSSSDTSHSDAGSRAAAWAEAGGSAEGPGRGAPGVAVGEEDRVRAGLLPSRAPPDRPLLESGRQGSLDSGIATASRSSYSGSFSSCLGSLDSCPGPGATSGLGPLASPGPDSAFCSCPSRPSCDYQVPTSSRHLYDTPRRLLPAQAPEDPPEEPSQTTPRDHPSGPGVVDRSRPPPGTPRTLLAACPVCGGLQVTPQP
ncbi:protein Dok-7 [Tachyglossus aculeatus]|uniref:protein Dok-7 n=1 Tax=Tachyglossus aculeatus TaxID=9261 RepID=UPI0018F60288|nr:protein Dok-7 [Tachyglossus aculeatus]